MQQTGSRDDSGSESMERQRIDTLCQMWMAKERRRSGSNQRNVIKVETRSGFWITELFVHFQDQRGLFRLKLLQQLQQFAGIEGFQVVVRSATEFMPQCARNYDRETRLNFLELLHNLMAGKISDAGIENCGIHRRECFQGLDGFSPTVCRDDIELCGLNDELAGGDAAGVFLVDYEKAGSDHGSHILWGGGGMWTRFLESRRAWAPLDMPC